MKEVFDGTTKTGTAGGTLLTIFANIKSEDVMKTCVLAAIGALVSFGVTKGLQFVVRRLRRL